MRRESVLRPAYIALSLCTAGGSVIATNVAAGGALANPHTLRTLAILVMLCCYVGMASIVRLWHYVPHAPRVATWSANRISGWQMCYEARGPCPPSEIATMINVHN